MKSKYILLLFVLTFSIGFSQEQKEYYDDGQLKSVGNIVNGVKEGLWKEYYEYGPIKSYGNFSNGEKNGEWKEYHENGQLKSIGNFTEDKLNGEYKMYYNNEELKFSGYMINDKKTGEWKYYYYKIGKLKSLFLFQDDKKMDIISVYDGKGNVLDKGTLVNGNGTVNYYNVEGKLIYIETYVDGYRTELEEHN